MVDISEDEITSPIADAADDVSIGKDAHVLEGVPAFPHDVKSKYGRSQRVGRYNRNAALD